MTLIGTQEIQRAVSQCDDHGGIGQADPQIRILGHEQPRRNRLFRQAFGPRSFQLRAPPAEICTAHPISDGIASVMPLLDGVPDNPTSSSSDVPRHDVSAASAGATAKRFLKKQTRSVMVRVRVLGTHIVAALVVLCVSCSTGGSGGSSPSDRASGGSSRGHAAVANCIGLHACPQATSSLIQRRLQQAPLLADQSLAVQRRT